MIGPGRKALFNRALAAYLDIDRELDALQEELDQYVRQLAGAFGLGGRDRPSGSAAERARLNVTRAVAIAKAAGAYSFVDAVHLAAADRLPDATPDLATCAEERAPAEERTALHRFLGR